MPDNKGAIPKLKSKDRTAAVDSRGYHDYGNVKHGSYNQPGKGGSGAKDKEADGGAWTTVTHGKGKRGGNPKGEPSSDREAMATPSTSKPATKVDPVLRKAWLKEGRCLACGSESHKVRDCALAPPREPSKTDTESVKDKQPMGSKSKDKQPMGSKSNKSSKGARPDAKASRSNPNGGYPTCKEGDETIQLRLSDGGRGGDGHPDEEEHPRPRERHE